MLLVAFIRLLLYIDCHKNKPYIVILFYCLYIVRPNSLNIVNDSYLHQIGIFLSGKYVKVIHNSAG